METNEKGPFVARMVVNKKEYGTFLFIRWINKEKRKAVIRQVFEREEKLGKKKQVSVTNIYDVLPIPTWMGKAKAKKTLTEYFQKLTKPEIIYLFLSVKRLDPKLFYDKSSLIGNAAWISGLYREINNRDVSL